MSERLRIATFNFENLFTRAKILNFANHESATSILGQIAELEDQPMRRPVIGHLVGAVASCGIAPACTVPTRCQRSSENPTLSCAVSFHSLSVSRHACRSGSPWTSE